MSTNQELVNVSDVFSTTAGELLSRGFTSVSAYLNSLAETLSTQAATTLSRAEQSQVIWQSLDEFADAALADLNNIAANTTDDAIRAAVDSYRSALSQSQSFASSAAEARTIAANLGAIGARAGALVGAAELIASVSDPSASTNDVARTAARGEWRGEWGQAWYIA